MAEFHFVAANSALKFMKIILHFLACFPYSDLALMCNIKNQAGHIRQGANSQKHTEQG